MFLSAFLPVELWAGGSSFRLLQKSVMGAWQSQVLVPHLLVDPHQPCFSLGKQSKSEYSWDCKMLVYEAEMWITTSFLIYHSLTNAFLKESSVELSGGLIQENYFPFYFWSQAQFLPGVGSFNL